MILQGNCIDTLKTLDDGSVDCCITSPPYWGLRDYGEGEQLGLEKTPEEYVANMVKVFAEVKRVLKDSGTLWLNLGDSYYGGGWKGAALNENSGDIQKAHVGTHCGEGIQKDPKHPIIKTKDLVGIPWMTAFGLRSDGWWLRQDIIWHKPNPMPESVRDRCTKAHEYIFLMSKSQKYYCDMEAVKEESVWKEDRASGMERNGEQYRDKVKGKYVDGKYGGGGTSFQGHSGMYKANGELINPDGKRNKRSVWTVTTKPYSEAHFATYPEELITPCVLAGCPEGGTILDPFFGAGTTGLVAYKHRRNYIGCELNESYIKIAEKRIQDEKDKYGLFE